MLTLINYTLKSVRIDKYFNKYKGFYKKKMANKFISYDKYRRGRVNASESVKKLHEMRKIFDIRGISYLTGISYDTLSHLTRKAPERTCSVQIASAIEYLYNISFYVMEEAKVIREKITNMPLKRKY